jgi:hypothetical protein
VHGGKAHSGAPRFLALRWAFRSCSSWPLRFGRQKSLWSLNLPYSSSGVSDLSALDTSACAHVDGTEAPNARVTASTALMFSLNDPKVQRRLARVNPILRVEATPSRRISQMQAFWRLTDSTAYTLYADRSRKSTICPQFPGFSVPKRAHLEGLRHRWTCHEHACDTRDVRSGTKQMTRVELARTCDTSVDVNLRTLPYDGNLRRSGAPTRSRLPLRVHKRNDRSARATHPVRVARRRSGQAI